MHFPFSKPQNCPKSPADIVSGLKESMAALERQDGGGDKALREKAAGEVSKSLAAMKEILLGTGEREPQAEAAAQLVQELCSGGLLGTLIGNLQLIAAPEEQKDMVQIFSSVLRHQVSGGAQEAPAAVDYLCAHQGLLFALLKGYEDQALVLNYSSMLRECVKHEPLAEIVLRSERFYDLFRFAETSPFVLGAEPFDTLKDLLTRHRLLSTEFLERNYDAFFGQYEKLLRSENYVTKRKSLQLLEELLLHRHNFAVMTKYVSKPGNLKLMMNLLRDESPCTQLEAFHVFKVFVANANKTQPILDILLKNQTQLVEFLSRFQNDAEDETFNDEKAYLVKQIRDLRRPDPQED